MWHHETKRLCIVIDDQKISVLLQSHQHEVVAISEYEIRRFELYQSLIFNPTRIQKFLQDFLNNHAVKNPEAVVLLRGSIVHELLIADPANAPDFYGVLQWLKFDDTCWYGAGLSYPARFQLMILLDGIGIALKAMVPHCVVMYDMVKTQGEMSWNASENLAVMQERVRTLFERRYTLMLDRTFLLQGLDALFDS